MENDTTTVQSSMMRMGMGVALLLAAGAVSMFFSPALLLVIFFMCHTGLEMVIPKPERDNMPYFNGLVVGPVKVGMSMFMIGFIYLIENHFWGELWIGATLIFLYSGFKDMYCSMRTLKARQTESGNVQTVAEPETARQRAKAEKVEEKLLAELADFLNGPDNRA
jgi:hypothetical protein